MDGLSLPMLLVLSGGHEFRKSIATSQECQRVVSFIPTEAEGRREAYHGFSNASPDSAVTTHV